MVRRTCIVSLLMLVNPLLFEVVEAKKSPTSCSSPGVVNATVYSQRNDTCETVVNFTNIEICEDAGDGNGLRWRGLCDEAFTQQDARVVCKQLEFSDAGATVGRLDQSVSFPSTFSPECTGEESNILDCINISRSGDCSFSKLIITCVMSTSRPGGSSTAAPLASTTNSELPSTTSVAPPPHTASSAGVDSTDDTNTHSLTSNTNVGEPGSSEQAPLGTIIIIAIAVSEVIVMLIVIIVVITAVLTCKRSSSREQNNDQVSPDSPVKVEQSQRESPVYETIMTRPENSAISAIDTCSVDLKENIAYETSKKITTETNETYCVL